MAHVKLNKLQVHLTATRDSEKLVRKVCRAVERSAKRITATGEYTTGNLSRSIHTDIRYRRNTVIGSVGSPLDHALIVHDGAVPHDIDPVRAAKLRFYWRRLGHIVYLSHVNHPGQRGKFYLTDPLRVEAIRYGFRYTDL